MELLIFFIGLLFGSFFNVCIIRLPLGQSIIAPRSHCTTCNNVLQWFDLIPVISCLALNFRCRYCRERISPRYLLVELLTACLFLWCYLFFGFSIKLIFALVLTSFLIVITFIDIDYQLILDKILIRLAGAGVIINLYTGNLSIMDMLTAGLAAGGLLLIIAIVSRGGMGGGDIKFMAALGLWLGFKLTVLTLFISFILGGIAGIAVLLLKLKGRKDYIPFGPFIAIGTYISMLYGQKIIDWYITMLI